MWPQRQNRRTFAEFPVAAPPRIISGTLIRVSTLLTAVGRRNRPACVGKGGLLRGSPPVAFYGIKKRSLFTADVSAGSTAELNIKAQSTAQDVFPEQSVFPRGLKRARETLCRQRIFAAQIDVASLRAGGQRANGHALQNRKGITLHQDAVFKCARLGFIGIADEILWPALMALRVQRLPFARCGKGCAATSHKSGLRDFAEYTFRPQIQGYPQGRIAVMITVIVKAFSIRPSNPAQQT